MADLSFHMYEEVSYSSFILVEIYMVPFITVSASNFFWTDVRKRLKIG